MQRLQQSRLAFRNVALVTTATAKPYTGFEQGPTRPPTERFSLKLRVSRNCPWNQCTFCPLYKKEKFSLRSVEDLKKDIDCIAHYVKEIQEKGDTVVDDVAPGPEKLAAEAARDWIKQDMKDVFLQDANTLLMDPHNLLEVLRYLRQKFPSMRRVTSYARSHTLSRLSDDALAELRNAGLDRVHVGFESGCDAVLRRVRKGATKAIHIKAGQKVKRAGMELSLYFMPGLGGQELTMDHAVHSAEAMNEINPDFIRVRSLFITPDMQLHEEMKMGLFHPLSETAKVTELKVFVEHLSGITSKLKSNDHFLNLLAEVDGQLPEAKATILQAISSFLALPTHEQVLYQIGKRAAIFRGLQDLHSPQLRALAEGLVATLGVTLENVDLVSHHLLTYFEQTLFRGGSFRFSDDVVAAVKKALQQQADMALLSACACTVQSTSALHVSPE